MEKYSVAPGVGDPFGTTIGVLQVTIRCACDIKGSNIGGGFPNPYASLTFNDGADLAKTRYKTDT